MRGKPPAKYYERSAIMLDNMSSKESSAINDVSLKWATRQWNFCEFAYTSSSFMLSSLQDAARYYLCYAGMHLADLHSWRYPCR
eukprot:scaffold378208_cov37-Prasinocladus_malaysianus.AAC.1